MRAAVVSELLKEVFLSLWSEQTPNPFPDW